MCGIAGTLERSRAVTADQLRLDTVAMCAALRHRGPDDHGVWMDVDAGVALGHRRLSILDVSSGGHQPMISHNGRYVLTFNGEIYNFKEIRSTLRALGHAFRSESDTEVLVEAIAEWGVDAAVKRVAGMFAFAVWDRDARSLFLARDRMGEKPLYYGWSGATFLFASEITALRAHPSWAPRIDREALTAYLRNSYVPGPRSIYEGVRKLPPGSILRIAPSASGTSPTPEPYWTLEGENAADDIRAAASHDDGAVDVLERLLREAVRQQLVADVPLGAFLSGGVDSSTVVALMQAESTGRVRTFTIGVNEPGHDEACAARAVAAHLGTDHTELYVTPEDALALIPQMGAVYDEPFADSSQIPTLLVSQLARQSVTVSLSGDGGDELFGGYERYVRGPQLVHRLGRIPAPIRRTIGRALLARPVRGGLEALAPLDGGFLAERTARLGEVLELPSPLGVHRALHSGWPQPASIVHGGWEPPSPFTASHARWTSAHFAERMLVTDAQTYLPDDLLVKVDRAAMSVSLETRVPILDHRVVEFAFELPWRMKVRDGQRKWILRQVLHRHVPRSLIDERKRGFSIPIGKWLRGPLREWASHLLAPERIVEQGLFLSAPITSKWSQHLSGSRDWSTHIWTILMFQAWYDAQT